jgi:hypothetical protein
LALSHISNEETEIIRSSLDILASIANCAESLEDMKTDIATDIYQTCLMMRQKVAKIIAAKSFTEQGIEEMPQLLEILDFIDVSLTSFKKKYTKFKTKAVKKLKKQA